MNLREEGRVHTEPSAKLATLHLVLQARPVEEEACGAVAGVDGDEIPFCVDVSALSLVLS